MMDGQGRNADSLLHYFGEDPCRYSFEEGLAPETINFILVCATSLEST